MGYQRDFRDSLAGSAPAAAAAAQAHDDHLEQCLEQLISDRERRSAHFAANLFSDPAWDILLALALAGARQQRLTVTGLCALVDAPSTTPLRWIAALTRAGLLTRRDDATDKRRKFIELSPAASASMSEYCKARHAATARAA